MVGRNASGDNLDIFLNTDPADEFFGSVTNLTFEDFVAILRYPRDMELDAEDRMG